MNKQGPGNSYEIRPGIAITANNVYSVHQYGGMRPWAVEGPGIPHGHGPIGMATSEEAVIFALWMWDAYRAGLADGARSNPVAGGGRMEG